MSGPSFWEFLLLCLIGLVVLGPKRLPEVANQIGTWIGQARRMTRTLKRQLEEELELDKSLSIKPPKYAPPRDDDTYSPVHEQPSTAVAGMDMGTSPATNEADDTDDSSDSPAEIAEETEKDRDERTGT